MKKRILAFALVLATFISLIGGTPKVFKNGSGSHCKIV